MNEPATPDITPQKVAADLKEQARNLGKQSGRDHVVNIVAAALNAVPIVGGSFASLIDDYIPQSQQQRLKQFAEDLSEEMTRVAEKIDNDYITTDEYAFLFTKTFQNVQREYQREKLEAYRNILINALLVNIDAAVQESYLNKVEQLTPLHLRLLSAFKSDAENAVKLGSTDGWGTGSISQTLRKLLPEMSEQHVAACAHDLDTHGITGNLSQTLKTMMTPHGASQLEGRLTPFGRGLVNFISRAGG